MARLSKAELATQLATNFADNTSGDISEADVRDHLTDIADSLAHLDDTDALSSGKQDADSDLTSFAANTNNGLITRTSAGNVVARTLQGTTDQVTVTNGNGVSGNPVVSAVVASQAEAEAGTDSTKLMTAQRTSQAIAALAGGGTDDQTAAEVAFTPVGDLAATDVQAALAELDTEKQATDADLTALAALSTTGMMVRTAAATYALRSIAGTANQIQITNGDGVSGSPTIAAVIASQAEAEAGTDAVKLMTAQRVSQAIAALGASVSLPVDDTTSIARDPVDNTKQVRLDAGGVATATTAVLTVTQDENLTSGTATGELVRLEDVSGSPGLPAVDGSQITGLQVVSSLTTHNEDLPAINDGTQYVFTITVTGASLGDPYRVEPTTDIGDLSIRERVIAANTVEVVVANHSGGTIAAQSGIDFNVYALGSSVIPAGNEAPSGGRGALLYEDTNGDSVARRPPAGFDVSIPGEVVAQTIEFRVPIGSTYSSLDVKVSAGSFTLTISIDGTAIGQANGITVNQTTRTTIALSTNHIGTEGDIGTIAISSPSSGPAPADFHMSLYGDVTAEPA